MFTFQKVPEFKWPVKIHVPADGGKKIVKEITAVFKVVSPERLNEHVEAAMAFRQDDMPRDSSDATVLREVLIGWEQVQDENGNAVEFSDENRDALIAIPYVRVGVLEAYFDATSGKAKAKN